MTNSNYPWLCNRGYAFGSWLSLSVHTFWAICEIKALSRAHVAPKSALIVLRTKNSLYMLDDYSNHAEAIKTALSSRVCMQKECADCGWPWPSLWPSWPNGSGNRNRDLGKSWAKFSYLTLPQWTQWTLGVMRIIPMKHLWASTQNMLPYLIIVRSTQSPHAWGMVSMRPCWVDIQFHEYD